MRIHFHYTTSQFVTCLQIHFHNFPSVSSITPSHIRFHLYSKKWSNTLFKIFLSHLFYNHRHFSFNLSVRKRAVFHFSNGKYIYYSLPSFANIFLLLCRHFRSGADITFHVYGPPKKEEKRFRAILSKWADRGYVGNITISEKDTSLRSLLSLQVSFALS